MTNRRPVTRGEEITMNTTIVCGDCGDELTVNPARGPGREVTVEVTPGWPFEQATVYDAPAYLHADDRTPACQSRRDAERRRAAK